MVSVKGMANAPYLFYFIPEFQVKFIVPKEANKFFKKSS